MAKFTRADFIRGAAQALSQQNFPAVYKNAHAALALGSPVGATYLSAFYHHQIVEGAKIGASAVPPEALTNFGIMYKVSEHYQVQGYTDFTHSYQRLFGNSKTSPALKKAVQNVAIEYTKYLQAKQTPQWEMTAVDIGTAEHMASTMEQSVLQQAAQNSHQTQAMEMGAPPPPAAHGYDHQGHHPEQAPLLGHEHSSKWCCKIL